MTDEERKFERRTFLAGAAGAGGVALAGAALPGTAHAHGNGESIALVAPVTPADPQYPDLVMGLNNRWTATPDSVYVVDSPHQVAPIVRRAVRRGTKLTVRGGGHGFEDFVYNSEVETIIDMTNMNRIYYDTRMKAVAVEAGAILLDVYEKLYQTWGVTLPGGVCYSVGMGGHVAGGGWGWLVRRNGLIVDHLYAVEVVTVNAAGRVNTIIATRDRRDPHRDLWWAHTGGGGGNFGVVTRYFFRSPGAHGRSPAQLLPKPPSKVLSSFALWSWSTMTEADYIRLLQNYASWHVANISPDSPTREVTSLIQSFHRSNGEIHMYAFVDSAVPNAQQMLDSYLAHLQNGVTPAVFAAQSTMPWLQFCKLTGTTNTLNNDPTLRGEYKSAFMKDTFTTAQAAAIYRAMTRSDINNPNLNIVISPYGGRTAAVPNAATAIPHREAAYKLLWQAQWANPADDAANIAWARETYRDTFADTGGVPVPNDQTDGCYVNYPDADLSDPAWNGSAFAWHDLYYKENYRRLQAVKKAYDPRNFFNHRQSVELPS
ncbi:FAD-binding oxidoreductase [Solwaraspora sp. WMMD792]|uniref:FAD-binding oxidoreductase n=1 Tax=unclassified Solwaraspora TaxID=2627926 RepID=UPI002416BBDB|nr:FAD-binding oxidoreductase [Solwaraspora sp. WMMD792]MDG4772685.1 FAD-binding oxidoreductase [Solwaraspora sp. WMMD792]